MATVLREWTLFGLTFSPDYLLLHKGDRAEEREVTGFEMKAVYENVFRDEE